MAYEIIGGHARKKNRLFKSRVAILAAARGTKALQMISASLMMGIQHQAPGHPPIYAAPTLAGWENLRHTHPEATEHLDYIGTLASVPNGDWAGHIDWVQPIDGMKIADQKKAQAHVEGHKVETKPMQNIRVPVEITEEADFIQRMMRDGTLNAELVQTKGGADMLASILRAAVRVAKEEA